MKDLMEKYYNVIYYCAYKILFYILYRLINPFYWIRLKKWNNNYINRIILISKKIETDARCMYYRYSVSKNKNNIDNCIYI